MILASRIGWHLAIIIVFLSHTHTLFYSISASFSLASLSFFASYFLFFLVFIKDFFLLHLFPGVLLGYNGVSSCNQTSCNKGWFLRFRSYLGDRNQPVTGKWTFFKILSVFNWVLCNILLKKSNFEKSAC